MSSNPAELDRRLPQIDWSALPAGASRDTVSVPSGSLIRVTLGPLAGRRVVLVPGATGSKEDFQYLMPLLAAAGYRVESFDLAGQFDSATAGPENLRPPTTHYGLELFVADVTTILAAGPRPAHLLGYSFAGTVAALAANRRPDLVSSLTLLSTPPLAGRALRGMRIVGPLAGRAPAAVSAAVLIAGIRWSLAGGTAELRAFMRARLRRTRPESVRDIMRVMTNLPELPPLLRSLRRPLLVAVGSRDLWPLHYHRDFAAACGAELAIYRAGHGPSETAPHQLATDMLHLFARAEKER